MDPGLRRGDRWMVASSASQDSASSRAFASFRSCVSKPPREPAVDWREEVMGLGMAALVAVEPGQVCGHAQFAAPKSPRFPGDQQQCGGLSRGWETE